LRLADPAAVADALAALFADAFEGETATAWSAASIRGSAEAGAAVFVDDAAAPEAAAILRLAGDEAELLAIGVVRRARRRGFATALLAEAEAFARAAGAVVVHLEVAEANPAACALYARAGYRPVGRRRDYHGRGAHALSLMKRL
jgi:ribosomal-protein-alanine N-acetyltransferase